MRDYYYILGISEKANEQEIKSAYRKLSNKFHPDKNNGEKFFEERFKEILEAYEILSKNDKRKDYDLRLSYFKASRPNSDDLKKKEEDLRRKFEEEYRKKQEELRKTYEDLETKTKNESEKGKESLGIPLFFIIVIFIGLLIYFLLINQNESKSTISDKSPTSPKVDYIQPPLIKSQASSVIESNGFDPDKIILIIDTTYTQLSKFPDSTDLQEQNNWRKYIFTDIDGDNIPELLTYYYTGGAHTYNYNFFQQISTNTFKSIFSFEGGYQAIDFNNNKLKINLYAQLGYFYTCYACNMSNELPNGKFTPYITLVYEKGALYFDKQDTDLNQIIFENLTYLKNRDLPKLVSGFDDGTRKAYAEHIITFYFNNEKNIDLTKNLFTEYYIGNDNTEIWDQIVKQLDAIFDMSEGMNEKSDGMIQYLESLDNELK